MSDMKQIKLSEIREAMGEPGMTFKSANEYVTGMKKNWCPAVFLRDDLPCWYKLLRFAKQKGLCVMAEGDGEGGVTWEHCGGHSPYLCGVDIFRIDEEVELVDDTATPV